MLNTFFPKKIGEFIFKSIKSQRRFVDSNLSNSINDLNNSVRNLNTTNSKMSEVVGKVKEKAKEQATELRHKSAPAITSFLQAGIGSFFGPLGTMVDELTGASEKIANRIAEGKSKDDFSSSDRYKEDINPSASEHEFPSKLDSVAQDETLKEGFDDLLDSDKKQQRKIEEREKDREKEKEREEKEERKKEKEDDKREDQREKRSNTLLSRILDRLNHSNNPSVGSSIRQSFSRAGGRTFGAGAGAAAGAANNHNSEGRGVLGTVWDAAKEAVLPAGGMGLYQSLKTKGVKGTLGYMAENAKGAVSNVGSKIGSFFKGSAGAAEAAVGGAEAAGGAARGASTLSKVGGILGKVGKVAGKVALPVTAALGAFDAYKGWNDAQDKYGTDGKDVGFGIKAASAANETLKGLSFGLINLGKWTGADEAAQQMKDNKKKSEMAEALMKSAKEKRKAASEKQISYADVNKPSIPKNTSPTVGTEEDNKQLPLYRKLLAEKISDLQRQIVHGDWKNNPEGLKSKQAELDQYNSVDKTYVNKQIFDILLKESIKEKSSKLEELKTTMFHGDDTSYEKNVKTDTKNLENLTSIYRENKKKMTSVSGYVPDIEGEHDSALDRKLPMYKQLVAEKIESLKSKIANTDWKSAPGGPKALDETEEQLSNYEALDTSSVNREIFSTLLKEKIEKEQQTANDNASKWWNPISWFKGMDATIKSEQAKSNVRKYQTQLADVNAPQENVAPGTWVPEYTNASGEKVAGHTAKPKSSYVSKPVGEGLGDLSAKYESAGLGIGAVSSGKGDKGGISYGKYQLSTNMGTAAEFAKKSAYANEFKGLTPGTPEFGAKWKEVANRDPVGFEKAQTQFIADTHYNPMMEKLKAKGIDLSNQPKAVQQELFSISTQHGDTGGANLIGKALKGSDVKNMSSEELMDKVFAERSKTNSSGNLAYFSKDPNQHSLKNRFINEKADVMEALAKEKINSDTAQKMPEYNSEKVGYSASASPDANVDTSTYVAKSETPPTFEPKEASTSSLSQLESEARVSNTREPINVTQAPGNNNPTYPTPTSSPITNSDATTGSNKDFPMDPFDVGISVISSGLLG